jgi:hypothetical protein
MTRRGNTISQASLRKAKATSGADYLLISKKTTQEDYLINRDDFLLQVNQAIVTLNLDLTSVTDRIVLIEQVIPTIIQDIIDLETSKQNVLVSGVNIKTVNGNALIGTGNIEIIGSNTALTAGNGLSETLTEYELGGLITRDTYIEPNNTNSLIFEIGNKAGGKTFQEVVISTNNFELIGTSIDIGTTFRYFIDTDNANNATIEFSGIVKSLSKISYDPVDVDYNSLGNDDLIPKVLLTDLLADKQDLLVSGTNIKTINGESFLGAGDLIIAPSFQIVQSGATYPIPTVAQLAGSITYIGYNYPLAKRQQDLFFKTLNKVTLEPATNVTANSFTANWLNPQYLGEDSVLYNELVTEYVIERSLNNFSSIAQTVRTSALTYTFDSLTTAIQYIRVRAVQEIQQGITDRTENSTTQAIDLTLVVEPVLALAPNMYLTNGVYTDFGSNGGNWTNQGTIDNTGGLFDLNSANAVIFKDLASTLNIGSTGTEQFCAVLWINLGTVSTGIAFLTLIETLLTGSNRLLLEGRSTENIRLSRVATASGDLLGARDGTYKKYVIEWRSGNLSVKVNPLVGGTSELSAGVSKFTGAFNVNTISLGANAHTNPQLTVAGNPIISKFAFWRGTIPTHDEIAILPI